ncbi:PRK06851 family protein [Rummeliibacillus sp. G93]|uniref:PRK06851 family protein n=1 Tax=Rummeliibacillus sp. G93 TaxID=2939494 RepID=UPI00201C5D7D|nr:PRK06851 family protein [Rummeliibacillus sp. G93]UQW96281.1 PRK06851 family protein [Rummeliibacillus sp. G93]
MKGNEFHYFAGGNTSKGFYSLFESALNKLDKLYILKGGPGNGKSTLMKKIAGSMVAAGFDTEYLHCSSDADSLDGIVIPSLKIGIVDGTAPHVIEPKIPGAVEEYVNLSAAWDTKQLAENKDVIQQLSAEKQKAYTTAYENYNKALAIHDEWEAIFISNTDYDQLDELAEDLQKQFFGDLTLNKDSAIFHRFLGAATPNGAVDFVPNLTEGVRKRYFLKGRPGTGKSTLLKRLAKTAKAKGFDVEIYHCGFDPNSLDMLIFRELGIAIFDSTAPHEYFPTREGDEIIDLYNLAITSGTDEKYESELQEIQEAYKSSMDEATVYLAKAKAAHEKLENIYVNATDFKIVDQITTQLEEAIQNKAEVFNRL